MFRVKDSEENGSHSLAEWVVQVALLFALVVNFGCDLLILEEYRRLEHALDGREPMAVTDVVSLRQRLEPR